MSEPTPKTLLGFPIVEDDSLTMLSKEIGVIGFGRWDSESAQKYLEAARAALRDAAGAPPSGGEPPA